MIQAVREHHVPGTCARQAQGNGFSNPTGTSRDQHNRFRLGPVRLCVSRFVFPCWQANLHKLQDSDDSLLPDGQL